MSKKKLEDFFSYSVEKQECGEVGSLLCVKHVDKLGTENGVCGRESTPREDAQLQELSDGAILGDLCRGDKSCDHHVTITWSSCEQKSHDIYSVLNWPLDCIYM